MFETSDSLRTWSLQSLPRAWSKIRRATFARSANCPVLSAADTVEAEQLANHRLAYLEYEGSISRGRGIVHRVAEGSYGLDEESPNAWDTTVEGEMIRGQVMLHRDSASSPWRLTFRPKRPASTTPPT